MTESRLDKIASGWGVAPEKAARILIEQGMSVENINKLAEVLQPTAGASVTPAFSGSVAGTAPPANLEGGKPVVAKPAAASTAASPVKVGSVADVFGLKKNAVLINAKNVNKTIDRKLNKATAQISSVIKRQLKKPRSSPAQREAEALTLALKREELSSLTRNRTWRGLAEKAFAPAVGTAALLGGVYGVKKVKDILHEKKREKNLKQTIAKNPDLLAHPEEKIREFHHSLHDYNPDISKNPALAGSWLRSHLRYSDEGLPISSLKDLSDTRKSHQESQEGASIFKDLKSVSPLTAGLKGK